MGSDFPSQSIRTKALVVEEANAPFKLMDVILDEVRDDELLIEMKYSGVCHTDIVVQHNGVPVGDYPAILGHEGAGIVRRVGSAVKNKQLKEGQNVLLSFHTCRNCVYCKAGNWGTCPQMTACNFTGTRLSDGSAPARLVDGRPARGQFFGHSSFSKMSIVPEDCVVPCDLPEDTLALLAPLGCGYQTGAGTVLNALKPAKWTKFAVFGVGAVGVAAMLAAKAEGVETLIAVDILQSKLDMAAGFGATHLINTSEVQDLVSALKNIGVDQIIDTTGVSSLIEQGIKALSHAGTLALVGLPRPDAPIQVDPLDIMLSCKNIIGVIEGRCNPPEFLPQLIELFKQGRFPVDKLGKVYPASSIDSALKDLKRGSVIKPILSWANV
ncbi:Alcohol dehydrogenase GroES-like domain-containing protein [Cladophialophora immunda]|nr:Alcohol dehydrogenase GroES-like domain-containing protein [Cladophialophora immunda]